MKEQDLTESESLHLITSMIKQAKTNYHKGGSFYFLLWGWVVMLANLGHYLLITFTSYEHPYIVWAAMLPAGIISGIYAARQRKKALVITHLDSLYSRVWIGVGFGIILSLIFMDKLSFNHNAVILMLATSGVYISGQLLKFKPLVFGSYALALSAIVAFNVSFVDQNLVAAVGIFFGYLVPGYLLKSKEK